MELIDKILDWGDRHWKLIAIIGFIAVCILNHQENATMSKIKSHYWEELTEQEEESETKKKCKK